MSKQLENNHPHEKPTRRNAIVFRAKATLLQIHRGADNLLTNEITRFPTRDSSSDGLIIGQSKTLLWSAREDSEVRLSAGKVHNLRLALRRLNGVEIPAGHIFSFWAQLGRTSKWKGYVAGRELREGCIIPTIGGGLCQLSNALYDAALSARFEIVERHRHTQVIPGSLAEVARDATVFWNYVDLRFKSSSSFRIEAMMDAEFLTVCFRSIDNQRKRHTTLGRDDNSVHYSKKQNMIAVASYAPRENRSAPQSCVTCCVSDCFRHNRYKANGFGRTAYLVDEYYPEFDSYIRSARHEEDLLAIPLKGKIFGKANYGWTTEGFGQVKQSLVVTLLRAYQSRKLSAQGAARQRALLAYSERLARGYSAFLNYDVLHVTVAQNLLPFLWCGGYLGGRTFDVLMTSTLARLHERLDAASALHPESKTLAEFRAPDWLVRAESQALNHSRRIVTPHSEFAALFPDTAILLEWAIPADANSTAPKQRLLAGAKIVFPAPTVGRKGAYELRSAVQGLGIQIVTTGAQLEGSDFWHGIQIEHRSGTQDWLEAVDAVVLPAFVEHKPRRLLEAVARGKPVIASTACGLANVKDVITVPVGDVEALRAEIKRVLSVSAERQPF